MNLSELDSLYAKSTPPDWRTRAEVDFFTALWDSYPALRDRLRALEAALRTQGAAWKELAGIAARAEVGVPGFVVHQIATAGKMACAAALDKEAGADWMNPLDPPDIVSLIDPDLDLPD